MTTEKWVRANCRFAQASSIDILDGMHRKSFDNFKVIGQSNRDEVVGIEQDRFNPASQYGHYTSTVGSVKEHEVDLVIRGNIYYPDQLAMHPDFQKIGDFSANMVFALNESSKKELPKAIYDVVEYWDEITKANFAVTSAVRNGDYYDTTIECHLEGQTMIEEE